MSVTGVFYHGTSKVIIQWLFEADSSALSAVPVPLGHAMLAYDSTAYPALHNATLAEWCVNTGGTLPILKTIITLSADKPTFDADGVLSSLAGRRQQNRGEWNAALDA